MIGRQFRTAVFLFLAALPLKAAAVSLAGNWKAVAQKLDDGTDELVYLQLQQNGPQLTGRVIYAWGMAPLKDGHLEGNQFHFSLPLAYGGWVFHFEGQLADGKLKYRSSDWGGKWTHFTAVPAPAGEGDPPARIAPPAPHPVASNGLAKTPPMGWNSWNKFGHRVSDAVVRQMADVMVASGMRDAGYTYLNIDDTWQGRRDRHGVLQPNSKFPDMPALAAYVHSKGLKLGIYSSPGPKTCGGYEGSFGHEELDAKTWAGWGIDYLKYDWCSAQKVYRFDDLQAVYQKMGDALLHSGRSIVYSLCEYGLNDVWKWGPQTGGNLWRTTDDINDSWKSMSTIGFNQAPLAPYTAPGHWNDPDMLEIGNGGMTADEYRAHMSLWSMLSAPLLAGNDLINMTPETKSILLNQEVIAIDQDSAAQQGKRIRVSGEQELWTKPLQHGAVAVALFNRGSQPAVMQCTLSELNLSARATARDLWAHQAVHFTDGRYTATVPAHGVELLRIGTN